MSFWNWAIIISGSVKPSSFTVFSFGGGGGSVKLSSNLFIKPSFHLLKGRDSAVFPLEVAPIEIIFIKSGVILVLNLKSETKVDSPELL